LGCNISRKARVRSDPQYAPLACAAAYTWHEPRAQVAQTMHSTTDGSSSTSSSSSSTSPLVALGLLSAATGGLPRRAHLRSVFANFEASVHDRLPLRFLVAAPPGRHSYSASVLAETYSQRDMLLLNESESPFRCALKYVSWFAWAQAQWPSVRFIATGDDDAYIQLDHLEADLRHVRALVGDAPTLWGLVMWRSHYDSGSFDTSTGFMGWGHSDAQASRVRREMDLCERERLKMKRASKIGAVRSKQDQNSTAAALMQSLPGCSSFATNRRRFDAILQSHVDWTLPPWPMANGPLFAVSRSLAGMLVADLGRRENGPRQWVEGLERTPLGQRYLAAVAAANGTGGTSRVRGGMMMRKPAELQKRACWPNVSFFELRVPANFLEHGIVPRQPMPHAMPTPCAQSPPPYPIAQLPSPTDSPPPSLH
jgi:hypothetical protein